jgi:hypothetical protein
MHNNINTHVHVRKKTILFVDFITHCPLMHETKILQPLQINGNYPFSQQYFQTQENKIFQSLKDSFLNDDISFFEYLNL